MNADGQTHQATLLRPGDRIDEFRIISVLGDGGFSVVYKAEDTELERLVAIKQFNPSAFSEPTSEARFLREAKLAASLNHPNIVSIYTFKRQTDSLFLIMEYLDGGSVRDLLNTYGYLTQGTLIKLALHVCQALDVLHGRGVIHRDIKPENILCTAGGDFKLADFGLAHMAKVDRRRGAIGPQSGTLLYMSPEQAAGEPVTPASDIYSFATVLYECLTGTYYLPEPKTEDDVITAIMSVNPMPPSRCNPHVLNIFDAPLLKALTKDPARRYGSAGEFLDALKAAATRKKRDPLTPELANELYTIRTLRDLLNEPEQALARLNAPWVRDSDAPEVLAERGETLVKLGDPGGYTLLESAVGQKRALPFAQIMLAEYYGARGDDDLWSLSLIDAIETDADLVYASYYGRIVELATEESDDFWRYVSLFMNAGASTSVYFNLGRVLLVWKGYESEAIAAFDKAVKSDPTFGPAQVAIGSAHLSIGNPTGAILHLEAALNLTFPTYPENEWHKSPSAYRPVHAYLGLAIAYANTGQFIRSVTAANAVLDSSPDDLADHADSLLALYRGAAEVWLDEENTPEAVDLLTLATPLAVAYYDILLLTLLGRAQIAAGAELRHEGSFSPAIEWIMAGIDTLKAIHTPDPAITALRQNAEIELRLAKAGRR